MALQSLERQEFAEQKQKQEQPENSVKPEAAVALQETVGGSGLCKRPLPAQRQGLIKRARRVTRAR